MRAKQTGDGTVRCEQCGDTVPRQDTRSIRGTRTCIWCEQGIDKSDDESESRGN